MTRAGAVAQGEPCSWCSGEWQTTLRVRLGPDPGAGNCAQRTSGTLSRWLPTFGRRGPWSTASRLASARWSGCGPCGGSPYTGGPANVGERGSGRASPAADLSGRPRGLTRVPFVAWQRSTAGKRDTGGITCAALARLAPGQRAIPPVSADVQCAQPLPMIVGLARLTAQRDAPAARDSGPRIGQGLRDTRCHPRFGRGRCSSPIQPVSGKKRDNGRYRRLG